MSFLEFVQAQRQDLPIVPTPETVTGRTYIITGSNGGIGFEAVKHLVNLGAARVIMAVRSVSKGNEAKSRIDSSTGRPDALEVWHLDMASYASIRAFAKKAATDLDRVDVLVENATAGLDTWTTSEGMETSITVNVIGTVLLALLMLPKMRETAARTGTNPHIVVVTSGMGFDQKSFTEMYAEDDDIFGVLNVEGKTPIHDRYSLSKLLQIFVIRQLASLIPVSRTGVVLNLLSPGLCNTGLARHARLTFRVQNFLMNLALGRTPEMGSRTILHALAAGRESHGEFISDCEIKDHLVPEYVKIASGQRFQERTWSQLARLLERIKPGSVEGVIRD
ncbi:short-chain dehydrogenase reductase family [Colletotrichum musicola]|uniref:Short-chain dehydrogenase reductase family n=1 Tax=Colletotrichum musicola TaxID=2175873 RepID=A0A8H6J274_9PEZI|nr:short-chain dehydrogenase reductase family [Colletotrichum musicola]